MSPAGHAFAAESWPSLAGVECLQKVDAIAERVGDVGAVVADEAFVVKDWDSGLLGSDREGPRAG